MAMLSVLETALWHVFKITRDSGLLLLLNMTQR